MLLTALMLAVLLVSFGLMFGLVKFTEVIIDRAKTPAAGDAAAAGSAETATRPS